MREKQATSPQDTSNDAQESDSDHLCVFVSEVNHPDAKRSAVTFSRWDSGKEEPNHPTLIVGERKTLDPWSPSSDLPIDR